MRIRFKTHGAQRLLCAWLMSAWCCNDWANGERTLAMIKPDAHPRQSEILLDILDLGFTVVEMKELQLHQHQAREFYREHSERSFFSDLVDFMSSGPITPMVLEREDAVAGWRQVIGPTDPVEAASSAPDSLRAKYGTDNTRNALHGSDSPSSAEREIAFFFPHMFSDLIEATGPGQSLDVPSEAVQGRAGNAADPETDADSTAHPESEASARSFLSDLTGLSKDEILRKVSDMAKGMGEDISAVVDRLNGRTPSPDEHDDHSEL